MARFYTDENFPLAVVKLLRSFGYDVLTALEAGNANRKIPDEDVLAFAIRNERAILTRNRRDFIRLHRLQLDHAGIVVCAQDDNFERLAIRINDAISAEENLRGKLIRVNLPS